MSKFKGKKVLVVGLGQSGVATSKYMAKQGAKVMISEAKQKTELAEAIKQTAELKVEYEFGGHQGATFKLAEMIVVGPAVPLDTPALQEAKAAGIPITSETEIAVQHIKEPIIAITGSLGKTTTASLIAEMLRADGKTAYLAGPSNPLINYLSEPVKSDYVVLELSSFQLRLLEKLVPSVAVFLNVHHDHVEKYASIDAYLDAKKKLLKLCDRNSYVVLNKDDVFVSRFAEETPARVSWFTRRDPLTLGGEFAENFVGTYVANGSPQIHAKFNGRSEAFDTSKIKIFGDHNKENVAAAVAAVKNLGVSAKAIASVIENFKGVPHRLEFIRKKDGVYFFNDSKSTTPQAIGRALAAFKKSPVILISGGKDSLAEYGPLADQIRGRVKILILLGEAKEKLNRMIGDFAETYLVGTFEEALLLAFQKSRTGDVVLLSPGCPSYDMFRNYEERGDYFKKLVQQL